MSAPESGQDGVAVAGLDAPGQAFLRQWDYLRQAEQVIRRDIQAFRPPLPLLRLEKEARAVASPQRLIPPTDSQETLRIWRSAKASGTQHNLPGSFIRRLAWEPEAVWDPDFRHLLDRRWENSTPSIRIVQALVRALHLRWVPGAEDSPSWVWLRAIMQHITFRDSELARRWKEEGAILLGPDGPSTLGRLILRENLSVSEVALQWGLGEGTPYFWEAVSAWAIPWAQRGGAAGLDRLVHFLLPWASRQPYAQLWKEAIGKVILEERFSQEGHDQNRLKAFVLSAEGLGDPRLPLNRARWNGVPDSARFRVLQWLTKADLGLFFETLLPRGKDPHNRKPFWIRYLDSVISSRPLLTPSDLGRVKEAFRGKEDELQHVGRVDQTLPCSAFILLFRDVLIVEFTTQGCAYFYTGERRKHIESIMWEGRRFSSWELKSTHKADINIPHTRRWEERMESALANYGIRPKGGTYSPWGNL